jgi:hypothetical protein
MRNLLRLFAFMNLAVGLLAAQSVTCPTAPNLVSPTVIASVTQDPTTNLYTYAYTVANASTSQQEVSDLAIDFASPLSNVVSPTGWTNSMFADRNSVHWKATAAAPLPADQPDVGQSPPGLYQVKPGTSLTGFSFQSPHPAGPVNFYALGYADIGTADTELDVEPVADTCPSVGGFFDLAVLGTTQGPVQFIPVQITFKPGQPPSKINPADQGVVTVSILSSSSFNAPASVDPASVRFGPLSAAPTDSGTVTDADGDGRLDLMFHFPIPSTGIACGDTSETLTGMTLSGTSFRGSASVVTVNCKK